MLDRDLSRLNAELALLMRERLGIRRGDTLAAKLRAAGRLVPRAERKAGRVLVDAEARWENPKLRKQIDYAAVAGAETRLRGWLATVDAADRRRGVILGVLAGLAFNFLVIATGVIVWMAMTGRV